MWPRRQRSLVTLGPEGPFGIPAVWPHRRDRPQGPGPEPLAPLRGCSLGGGGRWRTRAGDGLDWWRGRGRSHCPTAGTVSGTGGGAPGLPKERGAEVPAVPAKAVAVTLVEPQDDVHGWKAASQIRKGERIDRCARLRQGDAFGAPRPPCVLQRPPAAPHFFLCFTRSVREALLHPWVPLV